MSSITTEELLDHIIKTFSSLKENQNRIQNIVYESSKRGIYIKVDFEKL